MFSFLTVASVLFGSFRLLSLSFRRPFEPGGCKCGCVRYAHPELASRDAGVCVWREGVSETTAETERERGVEESPEEKGQRGTA